jgi:hypothetical protein
MKQKAAVSIYFVLIVLIGVLMIAMAISSFMLLQQKMSIETGLSSKAYQAADTGMERVLLAKKSIESEDQQFTLSYFLGGFATTLAAEFNIQLSQNWMCSGNETVWFPVDSSGECSFCLEAAEGEGVITNLKSIGRCKNVQRAIEVAY